MARGRIPMAKLLFARIVGAVGIAVLALFFVGLIPFLSADPSVGAGLSNRTPPVSVDRQFKGDKLPLFSEVNSAAPRGEAKPEQRPATPADIPVGCDASFSPVSAPQLAYIYGRCAT
jgi:hypothetical protein